MIERIARTLRGPRALFFPLGFMLWGVTLLVFSALIGVAEVNPPSSPGRNVGYIAAPNWAVVYALLMPILAGLAMLLVHQMDQAVDQLQHRRMFLDPTTRRILSSEDPRPRLLWHQLFRSSLVSSIVLLVLAQLVSIWEWKTNSLDPLRSRSDAVEIDWSVAALFLDNVSPTANAVFALLAFITQGVGIALGFFIFILAIHFGAFVLSTAAGWYQNSIRLVPDVHERGDLRRGFEIFEITGITMLLTGVVVMLCSYLVVLQNQFLNSSEPHSSAWSLITDPVKRGVGTGAESDADAVSSGLVDILGIDTIWNYSNTGILLLAMMFLVVVCLAVPIGIVCFAAQQARRRVSRLIQDEQSPWKGDNEAPDKILLPVDRDKQTGMVLWPFDYLPLNTLVVVVVICIGSLLWYGIAPYLYGIALIFALVQVIRRVQALMRAEPRAGQGVPPKGTTPAGDP